ncbi:hypothetical protein BDW69DRAFT_155932 [Aspergillus filifer]
MGSIWPRLKPRLYPSTRKTRSSPLSPTWARALFPSIVWAPSAPGAVRAWIRALGSLKGRLKVVWNEAARSAIVVLGVKVVSAMMLGILGASLLDFG